MFGKDFGKGFSEGERNMNGNSYFNEQTLLRLKDHRRLIKKINYLLLGFVYPKTIK